MPDNNQLQQLNRSNTNSTNSNNTYTFTYIHMHNIQIYIHLWRAFVRSFVHKFVGHAWMYRGVTFIVIWTCQLNLKQTLYFLSTVQKLDICCFSSWSCLHLSLERHILLVKVYFCTITIDLFYLIRFCFFFYFLLNRIILFFLSLCRPANIHMLTYIHTYIADTPLKYFINIWPQKKIFEYFCVNDIINLFLFNYAINAGGTKYPHEMRKLYFKTTSIPSAQKITNSC